MLQLLSMWLFPHVIDLQHKIQGTNTYQVQISRFLFARFNQENLAILLFLIGDRGEVSVLPIVYALLLLPLLFFCTL